MICGRTRELFDEVELDGEPREHGIDDADIDGHNNNYAQHDGRKSPGLLGSRPGGLLQLNPDLVQEPASSL